MAIFYTVGNIKPDTVRAVAKAVVETEPDLEIQTVVLFNSIESEEHQNEQTDIYREYFGDFVYVGVRINEDGSINSAKLFSVFNNNETKIVDLSNGQKPTNSILFMAANLCKIDRIYYLMRIGDSSSYVKMRQVDCTSSLAKISCFDLIYYNDEISKLFSDEEKTQEGTLRATYDGLMTGIREYFSGVSFRSVISNVTVGNEEVIGAFWKFILKDEECLTFCKSKKISISENKVVMDELMKFAIKYELNGTDEKILNLVPIVSLLNVLKEYRNISAHYSKNEQELTEDIARISIILSIEVMKVVHDYPDLWDMLKEEAN